MQRAGRLILLLTVILTACRPDGAALIPFSEPALAPTHAECGSTLQELVDWSDPGAVLSVPACLYREAVTVAKPLTLVAQPGAEIRGSDVWTDWRQQGGYWVQDGLPAFDAHGDCRPRNDRRCLWPEQAFLDGRPLPQVAADPSQGQFAVVDGVVYLADDPRGHTVEITTRTAWIVGLADDVTIQGFIMRHAANDAQRGAISNNGHSSWTIQDNILADAHGQSIKLVGGAAHRLLRNDVSWNGQLGIGLAADDATGNLPRDVLVQGNAIHHNNTERFHPGWEAGGFKAAQTTGLIVEGNVVHDNAGPGIWCDLNCHEVVITNNRVGRNANIGILFEISDGALIYRNAVWENGLDFDRGGWGAGIVVSTSGNTEIFDNVLAWNGDGITVIEEERGPAHSVERVYVHDNVVASTDKSRRYGLAWLSELKPSRLFDPAANNRGERNAYWFAEPESRSRFAWRDDHTRLADFGMTPGGRGDRYLTESEKDRTLTEAGLPPVPER